LIYDKERTTRTVHTGILLGVFVCNLLCGCGHSTGTIDLGAGTEKDIATIHKLEDEFLVAHSFNDGAKLADFYTDDALLIPPHEPIVRGKKAIAEWYENEFKKAPPIENPTVNLEDIEVFGNLAFIRGNFILKFKGETADNPFIQNLRFISIWRKQTDGNWKFYCDIWNTNTPLPPKEQNIPSQDVLCQKIPSL